MNLFDANALRRCISLAIVPISLGVPSPALSQTALAQKQVLVLHSSRRDAQISLVADRDLPTLLEHGLGEIDYYSEYLDEPRFGDTSITSAFRDFLRLKYKNHRFDIVIAIDNLALDFLSVARQDLFPGTPVVFFAKRPPTPPIANSTGLVAATNLTGTLTLARALQPDLHDVFVIVGADPKDLPYEQMARDQFRPFEGQLTFTYLTGLPTADLLIRVRSLPQRSMIYYLIVNTDGAGLRFHPLEYADRIAVVANAPVYSWVDSVIDHGIVGGNLKSQTNEMRAIANLADRVLGGERADSIPVAESDLNVSQLDWRQLRRWGIDEARVPPGTLVGFRDASPWERYRSYVLSGVLLLVFQTILIMALLAQRTLRRRAEEQVRASEARLRASYERIRDLGARLLNAQETERSHLARELHDDISQQVAVLQIDLELLQAGLPKDFKWMIQELSDRTQDIAKRIHNVSHRLHPARLRLIGLTAAVNGLRNELSSECIEITFTHQDVPPVLSPDLTLCFFRIAQEALQNAVRHSGARHVWVRLTSEESALVLTVGDDGVGFDVTTAWTKGLGLISMSERLDGIGGTMDVRSSPGAGTTLEVIAPLTTTRIASVAVTK